MLWGGHTGPVNRWRPQALVALHRPHKPALRQGEIISHAQRAVKSAHCLTLNPHERESLPHRRIHTNDLGQNAGGGRGRWGASWQIGGRGRQPPLRRWRSAKGHRSVSAGVATLRLPRRGRCRLAGPIATDGAKLSRFRLRLQCRCVAGGSSATGHPAHQTARHRNRRPPKDVVAAAKRDPHKARPWSHGWRTRRPYAATESRLATRHPLQVRRTVLLPRPASVRLKQPRWCRRRSGARGAAQRR